MKRNGLPPTEPMPVVTPLDKQINEGVDLLRRLRELEAAKKLSRHSFVEYATSVATLSNDRLHRLDAKIEGSTGCAALQQFVRRFAKELAEPTFPTPPGIAKIDKCIRIYGSDAVPGELSALKITPAELCAIAARRSVERFPNSFGSVRNWDQHTIRQEQIRSALKTLGGAMLHSWGADDVRVERGPNDTQTIVFKRSVDLNPNMSDWSAMLIQRCLEQRERRQVERASMKAANKAKPKKSKKRRVEQHASA